MSNGTRHIYSACAVGVGAVLTSPAAEASWAASCLPIIGGSSSRQEGPMDWPSLANPVLHFDMARTEITGRQTGFTPGAEEYTTSIRKTVTNLNILNGKVVGSVDVLFTFLYKNGSAGGSPKQRDPVEVNVVLMAPLSLTINGAPLPPTFSFKKDIMDNAGKDFKKFQTGGPQTINADRPLAQHHEHEHGGTGNGGHKHGVIFSALAEPIGLAPNTFRYADPIFGRLELSPPDPTMDVFIGEWWAEPYRQSVTLLRVVLKGASGPGGTTAFSGEIVVDGEDNGRTLP